MDDLIKALFSGFGGAALMAIWALARHTPGSEAQLNFYLMCLVTILWVGRATLEFSQHSRQEGALSRLLLSNVLPAAGVAALFVYPYQYPTAYPLHAELRADLRGANRLVLYNSLRTYPDEGFAEPLANLRGLDVTPQRSNVYHLYVENRSYVPVGPLVVSLLVDPSREGLTYYAAIATPGDLRGNDGRYMYVLRRPFKRSDWLTYGKRCSTADLTDLRLETWCVVDAPVSPGTERPVVLGLPKMSPHSSYDIYFEIAVAKAARQSCEMPIQFSVRSLAVEADATGSRSLPLDKEVCR